MDSSDGCFFILPCLLVYSTLSPFLTPGALSTEESARPPSSLIARVGDQQCKLGGTMGIQPAECMDKNIRAAQSKPATHHLATQSHEITVLK